MPLSLVPPNPKRRAPNYRVRGTYLGVRIDRSTETGDLRKARAFLKRLEEAIERGHFTAAPELTFAAAATAYMHAGGEKRFLPAVLRHFGKTPVEAIDQTALDAGAAAVYPNATAGTRNRQFYTPALAVLRHAGIEKKFKRPKGAQGEARTVFHTGEQIARIIAAAEAEDAELAALVVLIAYTGLRLGEALRLRCADVDLGTATAWAGRTKNGNPRATYLPPRAVAALANHPRGLDRADRLFRWTKGSQLYLLAARVYAAAGVDDGGAPFHGLRHSYGGHMARAGADLLATGAWASAAGARRYAHYDVSEEARKADMLPGANPAPKRARRMRRKLNG